VRLSIILIILFVIGFGTYGAIYYNSAETITITVVDKERVLTGDASKYLVFTEDEVFENTDELLFLKFNSSDIYRDLDPGQTYNVVVVGWRVPFLSMYRNIIAISS
jgi:hypothetical protein